MLQNFLHFDQLLLGNSKVIPSCFISKIAELNVAIYHLISQLFGMFFKFEF